MIVSVEASKIKSETRKAFLIRLDGKEDRFIWFPKKFCRFTGVSSFTVKMWSPDNFGYNIITQDSNVLEQDVSLHGCFPERVFTNKDKKEKKAPKLKTA